MEVREFDLNIEKMLENWSVSHALREIIANALDEQILTKTKEIAIFQDSETRFHIKDYGRGLNYTHLTQNENEEKLSHPLLIGKFGVGLKDALATFDRNNITVVIDSRYGHITIGHSTKHGFDDITTLHAYIEPPLSDSFIGTEFCFTGCTLEDINDAKKFFLKFAEIKCLEKTKYGEIYTKRDNKSEIFINGIKVAEEDNFLFSYNITSLNSAIKKSLNRERTNVGRSAYSDRVKAILLSANSNDIISAFTNNLTKMSDGKQCDEIKWVDVQTHAVKLLHSRKETVFLTPEEIKNTSGDAMEVVYKSGKTPIFVPETVRLRLEGEMDSAGNPISTIKSVVENYNNSFEYLFVPYDKLEKDEKQIYDLVRPTLEFLKSNFSSNQILISESLHINDCGEDTLGIYEKDKNRIIILRSQLKRKEDFLGTLIHELTHADKGLSDISRSFETELTRLVGLFASKVIGINQCMTISFRPNDTDNNSQEKTDYENVKDITRISIRNFEYPITKEAHVFGYYNNNHPFFIISDPNISLDNDYIILEFYEDDTPSKLTSAKDFTISPNIIFRDNISNGYSIGIYDYIQDPQNDGIITYKAQTVNAPFYEFSPLVFECNIVGYKKDGYRRVITAKITNASAVNSIVTNETVDYKKMYGLREML